MRTPLPDTVAALLAVLLMSTAAAQTSSPMRASRAEIWIGPAPKAQAGRSTVLDLLSPQVDWPAVKQSVHGLKLYIDEIATMDPASLRDLARVIGQHDIPVIVECGGTLSGAGLDDNNGISSARIELAKIKQFYDAGGRVDMLDLDHPICRLIWPEGPNPPYNGCKHSDFTIETAADQLMNYMHLVTTTIKAWPGGNEIHFNLLSNFPNWGYRGGPAYHNRTFKDGTITNHTGNKPPFGQDWGDYDAVIRTALAKAKADPRGIRFAGVTVDNPCDYLLGEAPTPPRSPTWDPKGVDWLARVRDLEDFVRSQGLQFNLIVNTERGGQASNQMFYEDTLRMVKMYKAAAGRPDRYIIQSWYPHPDHVTPQAGPHGMLALAAAVAALESGPARLPTPAPGTRMATPGTRPASSSTRAYVPKD
jgi:hypothetical protein